MNPGVPSPGDQPDSAVSEGPRLSSELAVTSGLLPTRRTRLIPALASEIARVVPEFDAARYPSWEALFSSLEARVGRINLVLDEFPCPPRPNSRA